MNILIPHSWLLEHLNTDATPEQFAEAMSLSGPTIEHISKQGDETIYDIEVTTNRVDAMSIRGIAREAAAILPHFSIPASLKPLPISFQNEVTEQDEEKNLKETQSQLSLQIQNNPQLCHRIMAVKLSNVKLEPSPQWLQDRLTQVGQRPLNNAIDITNYVMFELGHPIHAFDYDKVTSTGRLIVREAQKGETFTTLENKTYTTVSGEVVFDDGEGNIIDLPGIMGTANTVVTDETRNILLWIESVDPAKIRHASLAHQIRSQAAILNEKGVDPHLADQSLQRATELFQQQCGAQVSSPVFDDFPFKPETKTTKISHQLIGAYLGTTIEPQTITQILQTLGCDVQHESTQSPNQTTYQITPPTYRAHDLREKVDYIEEIARIYGYHKLPSQLMDTPIPGRSLWKDPEVVDYQFEQYLKQLLSGFGQTEVYTYSLVSQKLAQASNYELKDHLKLSNPLSDDNIYLRRTLIPSHVEFLKENKQHQNITIFELANLYHPQNNQIPNHHRVLTITSNQPYPKVKGNLDALMQKLHIDYQVHQQTPNYGSLTDLSQNNKLETASEWGKIIRNNHATYHVIINYQQLQQRAKRYPKYIPLPQFPPVIQDLTFTLSPQTAIGPVIDTIYQSDPLISKVLRTDIYQQNHTFQIFFQDPEQNLSDAQIKPIRNKIIQTIQQEYQAELVGKF